ncbi:GL12828 [Drosophila persimilis]|uniref:Adipokinetic hormone n=2 Tax=pseudoobscura subgroup TaxID=32358 RepID=Q29D82_DROPS|nr:adipokinetic hormone [Drosophila pseudoobscura]XP_002026931.1 adipokinetic hormone [Drosophila persimilis]XP_017137680.1 adipokinetic hormone [Drosophila miranda]EDW34742.1 GL12828 [Drosophila persimilis]
MNTKSEVIIIAAVLCFLLACVEGQLTFSPDWGKRSVGGAGGGSSGVFFEPQQGNCKTSNEMLLEIFRFVQSQAQLFLDCKHRE